MRYRVLGPVTAHRDDDQIELVGLQRALLALLLIDANRVVSTDRIIDELWDDTGKDRQNALWVVVSRLRSALEPGRPKGADGSILVTRPPGYMLSVDADAVDSLRFQSLVAEGRALIDTDPKAASLVLNEALALWRGHAFEEFTYHAFAEAEIARLTELRLAAVEDRIGADLRAGRCHDLVAELESLVRQHPARERLAAHFMVALHQSGRQAEALRAFATYRAYLADEVGLDPSDEITRLEGQILLEDPALRSPEPPHWPTGPVTGLSVRGYELRELIGSGATGNVYAAFQPSVGREVAIKVVRPDMADDPDFIRRFEAEARIVAGLDHPRIVPVYDYWRENGGAYLVMRRFDGGNLRTILERGAPLGADASRQIVEEVAGALATAHRRGVTHGDLRPANILIDADGHAYLADFGLSYDLTTSARGEADYMAPEQVETGRPSVASDVYALGALLGRLAIEGTDSRVRHVVDRACAPDPAERFDDAGAFLVAYTAATGHPTDAVADSTGTNPYRGLEAFQEANAAVFFGRERLIERLLARIGAHGPAGRFVALVGPSGSGKSSVVRAGLVPALRLGAVPGSDRWFIATVVPGRSPFASLADALRAIAVDPPDDLSGQLRTNGIAPVVKRILADDEVQVVLIIDQLEELFVQSEPAEAAEFLGAVAVAVADRHSVVRVVVTLRADFYDAPLRHPDFGELMRLGTDAITPLNPSELQRAITGPAAHVGVAVDPGVVAAIASDMVGQPTALPLMQFALTELYDQRSAPTITVEDYLELGGLTSALAARADAVLADLTPAQRADAQHLFLRLVTLTDDAADTRRRARLSELRSSAGSDVSAVLDPFVGHRLLSVDRDPVTRGPTVEIAHEALLGEWATLRDWIDGARSDVRLHRRLAVAVAEWVAVERDSDYLLAGAQLSAYATWEAHSPVRLTGDEHAFLLASRDHSDAELVAERRRTRRLRRLVTGVAVALVAALVAGGLAYRQSRRADDAAQRASEAAEVAEAQRSIAETQTDSAEEQASLAAAQADVAESQTIAANESALAADLERMRAQAASEVTTNPPLAALLAAEAYAIDASPRGAGAVQRVLTGVEGRQATMVGDPAGYLGRGAISEDKNVVAVSSIGSVDVWDVDERSLKLRVDAGLVSFDLSPDGSLVAVAEGPERLDIVDVASGVAVGTIEERVCVVRFSPAGDRLGVIVGDGQQNSGCGRFGAERRLQIWDITDPTRPQLEYVNELDSVWDMWWSPDGAAYLSFQDGARIDFRDATTHEPSWTHTFDLTSGITQGSVASPRGALFRSDGSSVVVGAQFNDNSGIWLFTFDTETGDLIGTPTSTAGLVSMSWWNEEETQLVGTLQPSGATVLDLELGAEVQPPPLENPNASSVWLDRARDRMVVAGFVGIEVSSLDGRSVLERRVALTPEQLAVQAVNSAQLFGALTADGDRLLMSLIDRSGRAPIVEWDLTTDPATQIGRRPPGFAFANGESTLLFDATTVQVLDGNHEPLGPAADLEPERGQAVIWRASSDGSRHAPLRPTSGVLDIYDGRTGERVTEIVGELGVGDILGGAHSFSADGAYMMLSVQTTDGEQWSVIDTDTGDAIHAGGGEVWTQPWISGSTIYANLPNSFDIERRDVETLEVVGPPLVGHTLVLNAIEDDLDSDRIVTQATNGTVRVWDRESGDQIGREIAIGRQSAGTGIALARDGDLVGIFLDTEFAIWNYDIETWPELACQIAGRNMTQREWNDFGPRDAEYRVTCPQFPPGD